MARILAVDDSKMIRDLVKAVLSEQGHEVLSAADGVEAMDIARHNTVDLVLSDVHMPNMSGVSLVAKLRRLAGYESVPIVMVTTDQDDYKKKKVRSLGANGWLLKPFTQERLLNAVNKMLH